jgi:alpha-tubulin suppressor-like RCC1 family protein
MSQKSNKRTILSITIPLCLLLAMAWHPTAAPAGASSLTGMSHNPSDGSLLDSAYPTEIETLSFTAVTAGSGHTCGLIEGGGAKCWGYNFVGALGDGTSESRSTPVDVVGLDSGVAAIEAGSEHTCALLAGGSVKCWGANWEGELGDGTSGNTRLSPVDVVGLPGSVTAISAGSQHTCALLATTGVMCWGKNVYGQLGDSTSVDFRTTPVYVSGLTSGVLAISANGAHTCALLDSGGLKCWGYNEYGQLGNGTNSNRNTPVEVSGLTSGVNTVTAGGAHTCARLSDASVKCWGWNNSGQLGDGTTEDRSTPVDVNELTDAVIALAGGNTHTCALLIDGSMMCWGSNWQGELGDGTTTSRSTPVDVVGLTRPVTAMAAGTSHTCVLLSDGDINCWGDSRGGALGNGLPDYRTIPMDVVSLADGVADIAAGAFHTCALLANGGVKCWGSNSGQLGDGTMEARSTPVDVIGLEGEATGITAGYAHTCAVLDGGVKCWGYNFFGQLGDGTSENSRTTPVAVIGLADSVTAIAAAEGHTCALLSTGGVQCWGVNSNGQCGDGTFENHLTPANVSGLSSGVIAITAGSHHTCALLSSSGVKCWGLNTSGQLGNGTIDSSNIPVDVTDLSSGVTAITAGDAFTCALMAGGGVKCWGELLGPEWTPEDVLGWNGPVTAISGGGSHLCALISGSGVQCLGPNWYGQLGNGTTEYGFIPAYVSGMEAKVTSLATGGTHTCALAGAGRPKCWGDDFFGQLGVGKEIQSLEPVTVIEGRPSLVLNYAAGLPGSFFTLTGWDFPPDETLTLTINTQVITTSLQVNPTGSFIVFLDTTSAQAGGYGVKVSGSPSASTSFLLMDNALLNLQEGGGLTFSVPAGIAIQDFDYMYLPLIAR